MPQFILADSGPLYAQAMRRDGEHARAVRELKGLEAQGYRLLLAHPIILETHKLLLRRNVPPYAHDYTLALTERFHTVNPQSEDYQAGLNIIGRFADQPLSLFDATLAALATRLALPVWTFDHHFDILSTEVWRPS
jgi:predicted nucleic acid-binding protein